MSIMALKTRLCLSLVIPDSPGQSTSLEELRVTPGGIPRKIWHVLCSLPAQRALAWAIVLMFVAADITLVGQHALVRYQSYHADAFDLGNMDQAVWNTLHGHLLRFTNRGADWYGPPTRLGVHVEPILLLIAPLYLIYTDPETLLVLQTVALALGGIPLLLLGLRRLPELPPIDALLTSVPATASVAATDTLDPHLSDRYALYLLPDPQSYMADYVVIDLSDDIPANQVADQQMYAAMLVSGNFRIVGTAGQVVLLEHLSLQSPALQIQGRGAANERLFPGKHT